MNGDLSSFCIFLEVKQWPNQQSASEVTEIYCYLFIKLLGRNNEKIITGKAMENNWFRYIKECEITARKPMKNMRHF